ncbi:tryptophan--tRNA ligase, putative [Plasmodium chabaudi chabaudi]|uniref:tryptophan--tRNA ligase n=1 Tax=Plasmodium chabaudi chabaudi TaxID=31271 RepID=A0A4V0KF35_PLACU|nr:tryptophan--tRNA ligase, putative [Plasmodium chabaudi chabaudi]VTZ71345.1 tryptophan--tRNA ligase, putative [Plasmodium chabaudi chabaudi]|eukprot:XP_016655104.1 tryptophan--tRNA ligase, putative [Plasmodium chabaudi chabaudi]
MKKRKIIFLYFLIVIHINFYKNVIIKKKCGNLFYLYNTPPVNKQKKNFQLKNSCTFLTGIKPSGSIHLGNYIGCLSPIINLEAQNVENDINDAKRINKIILIADLHSLTNINNISSLKQNVFDSVKTIISLIINMYVKKKNYIDIYINDINIEYIIKQLNINIKDDINIQNLLSFNDDNMHLNLLKTPEQKNTSQDQKLNTSKQNDNHTFCTNSNIKQKHYFYIIKQSDIQQHTSLYYLINSFTSINMLNSHIHIKASENKKSFSLFSYPNLMLSDIMLYKPQYLIIGLDQKKNIEIIKKISKKINTSLNKHVIQLPKIYSSKFNIEIMNLDGHNKMSKDKELSTCHNLHKVIYLFDNKNVIEEKIRRGKTDTYNTLIYANHDRKEINNLINMYFFFYYHQIKNMHYNINNSKEESNKFHSLQNSLFLNNTSHPMNIHNQCDENLKSSIHLPKTHNEKIILKKYNINPNFNVNIINNILSNYNNNYQHFKYDLSQLIYNHFRFSKYCYDKLHSEHALISNLLKIGKQCLYEKASKTYKNFKRNLNI